MGDIIAALQNTPVPTILVVGGLVFLFLAVVGQFVGQITVPRERQIWAGLIGFLLLFSGVTLYVIPASPAVPTPTVAVAVALDTPTPRLVAPTDTPIPPTSTPVPVPTDTPKPTNTPQPPTSTPTPAPTDTPAPTSTPRPTPTPTATIDADPTVYDNFNNPAFDGKWPAGLWRYTSDLGDTLVKQQNGILTISRQSPGGGGLHAREARRIDEARFVEAKIKLDENFQASFGSVGVGFLGDRGWLLCDIYSRRGDRTASLHCVGTGDYESNRIGVPYNSWHTIRLEINPDTSALSFFLDGQQFDNYVPPDPATFIIKEFWVQLAISSDDGGLITGYIDDVRVGK